MKHKGYRTKVYNMQEGWDLICAMMRNGCSGVQNDSSKYNDIMLQAALKNNDYCWIGMYGDSCFSGAVRIIGVHDKTGRRDLKDISKSKFVEAYNLDMQMTPLPKSLC